jgi:hypothetical protein
LLACIACLGPIQLKCSIEEMLYSCSSRTLSTTVLAETPWFRSSILKKTRCQSPSSALHSRIRFQKFRRGRPPQEQRVTWPPCSTVVPTRARGVGLHLPRPNAPSPLLISLTIALLPRCSLLFSPWPPCPSKLGSAAVIAPFLNPTAQKPSPLCALPSPPSSAFFPCSFR